MSRDDLIIEQFLTDAWQARALQAAFDLSVIDASIGNGTTSELITKSGQTKVNL